MSKNMKLLTLTYRNICKVSSFLIGTHRVTRKSVSDYFTIVNGLTLFVGILLDCTLMLGQSLTDQVTLALLGRIKLPNFEQGSELDLNGLFGYLDDCDTALLEHLRQSYVFKGRITGFPVVATTGLCGPAVHVVHAIMKACANGDLGDRETVRLLRQIFCFFKKMEVHRPDLVRDAEKAFFEHEEVLARPVQGDELILRNRNIADMNALAIHACSSFSVPFLIPKHGPGAVADCHVKCWFEKNLNFATDCRIQYLLANRGLGQMSDYCYSLGVKPSTRTSRFVCVPKSWKKVRGISAEPVELQYFQQAVLERIDHMFTTSNWWRSRVNLHDQVPSGRLALRASRTGEFATVDLSLASDSVTTALVKSVFKGTQILPWLLGTRSTHTNCSDVITRITKFAPMGSACCFPVECMIFTFAAQLAVDRTHSRILDNKPVVRVFGDDIILDSYAYPELVSILQSVGFTVNMSKSYSTGYFREACGVDAYRGCDVTPLRYKTFKDSHLHDGVVLEEIGAYVAFCNACFNRGLLVTRQYVLQVLLKKRLKLGACTRTLRTLLEFSSDGESGTLISPFASNYAIRQRYDQGLQAMTLDVLVSRIRESSRASLHRVEGSYDEMKYLTWLISHQNLDEHEMDLDPVNAKSSGSLVDWTRLPMSWHRIPSTKWRVTRTAIPLR